MGPDLTNQLIGVLTRFRQEEIAVMADIEKMYFQMTCQKKSLTMRYVYMYLEVFLQELVVFMH